MNIHDLCAKLVADYGCIMHSGIAPAPGQDIDIYVPHSLVQAVIAYVTDNGFVMMHDKSSQHVFGRFEECGKFYILDLMNGFDGYTTAIYSMELSAAGNTRIGASPVLRKCFKYLCLKPREKFDYLVTNQKELADFLRNPAHFIWVSPHVVAATRGTMQDVITAVKRPAADWRYVKKFWVRIWQHPLCGRLKLIAKGGISLAFVGPDGSGKSFIIERMSPIGVTRTIYMGDHYCILQGLYNQIMHIPSPWNRFVYLFYCIENIFRRLKVAVWRRLGYIVLIDRFPGTNRNVAQAGILGLLNTLTYKMFPKPDLIVFLYVPPEVIFSRKQELSLREIAKIQTKLKNLLSRSRHLVLDTQNLDPSLNMLLAKIYR